MTSAQAGNAVVTSMVISGVTITLADVVGSGSVNAKTYIAGAVVYMMLAMLADFQPKIGGPLAILIAISVVLSRGDKAFEKIAIQLKGTK